MSERTSQQDQVADKMPPEDMRERIVAIIDAHPQGIHRGAPDDQCANCPEHPDRWISHLARALILELPELAKIRGEDK